MVEQFDDDLRKFINAVWVCGAERQFTNWIGRKINQYLHECKSIGGTEDAFWEWLDKAQAFQIRGKILLDKAAYIEERLKFVRSYDPDGNSVVPEVFGRALGVSPDRAFAEYDRRRTDGTLPLAPKH